MMDKDKIRNKQACSTIETVGIDMLTHDPANVRKHSERNLDAIRASLNRFGQQKPIVVNPDGVVIAGNGTLSAAKSLGWKEIKIVRTTLKGADATAFAIADNRTAELAEWDDDALAQTLAALQNDEEFDHLVAGFTDEEIEKLVGETAGIAGNDSIDSVYTPKITAPVYEPKGDCPSISELFNRSKAADLEDEVKRSGIDADTADFLINAAQRHTVFHFARIAEFYCHQSPEVQSLMEKSGLIIIDFDKAIENGFVHMTDRLGKLLDIEKVTEEKEGNYA